MPDYNHRYLVCLVALYSTLIRYPNIFINKQQNPPHASPVTHHRAKEIPDPFSQFNSSPTTPLLLPHTLTELMTTALSFIPNIHSSIELKESSPRKLLRLLRCLIWTGRKRNKSTMEDNIIYRVAVCSLIGRRRSRMGDTYNPAN